MSKKAVSTIGTVLKAGEEKASLSQLCKIKTYPDLGGTPAQLETTDLEDEAQTYTDGVKEQGGFDFTANYTKEAFDAVKAKEGTELKYQLEFGEAGADGIFSWTGKHSVRVSGGGVNAVREMVITCTPSSAIANKAVE